MAEQWLSDWEQRDFDTVEEGVLVARHRLGETGLFTDDALVDILDSHPPEDLGISTMGTDPHVFEWREGDRNGVSGATLLDLVRTGYFWLNIRKVLDHHPAYAKAVHGLYDEIERRKRGFRAENRTANLLISSPNAWVPYHVDMPVNMLWHIRGMKRVWVYPPFDSRFASSEVLGKVCAGCWSEDIPYKTSYDKYALVFDAEPGELITWPQLTPHRVSNLSGLNVSLSTEHKNVRARRRINVHTANHYLRERLHWNSRSISVDGAAAHSKQLLARACRLANRLRGTKKTQFVYPKTFVVDPDAPLGLRMLDATGETLVAPHLEFEQVE
jgi:hypothetical protein